MTKDAELKISSLLTLKSDLKSMIKEFTQEIQSQQEFSEQQALLIGLINMGFYKESLSMIIHIINESQNFPWKLFLFLLWKLDISPSKKHLDAIFKGAKEQDQLEELVSLKYWETWDPRFKAIRLHTEKKKKKESKETQDKQLSKASHLTTSSKRQKISTPPAPLSPQEKKVKEIKEHLKNVEKLWLKNTSSKNPSKKRDMPAWVIPQKKDKNLEKQALHLFHFIKEKKISDEKQLYNLALFFKFTENPQLCLQLLEKVQSLSADWLRVEAYLDAQEYLMVLEEASKIEQKYASHPETSFATTYVKAIAFRYLNQISSAIQLMEKITRIDPHYRATHLHLKDWKLLL